MLDTTSAAADYHTHYETDAAEFDYFEERDDPATAHDERRVYEALLRHIPRSGSDKKPVAVLDVGCGRAWVARTLCPAGTDVCSLDISLHNPQKAVERYPYPNHAAVVADAFALPFASGAFDAVVASEVIEHVPDPAAFVGELLRVVAPGGSVILSTPYKEKLRYVLCMHCNQRTPLHAHIHSFDERTLGGLAPAGAAAYSFETFGNKAMLFLRFHPLVSWMPHGLWRIVDSLANAVVNKRAHIVVVWRKPLEQPLYHDSQKQSHNEPQREENT
ncbi:MAG: class I SAM-dependent methyltransferase [Candidatus Kapabacteria bacterium]|nr:class I SAM-dependent methyltransferase [Candidatus Kapabacteria bacterium]